jgi:hypothetical protein
MSPPVVAPSPVLSWPEAPAPAALSRRAVAAVLVAASRVLDRVAQRLIEPRAAPDAVLRGVVEFHAEAGAPEGAIYVDGQFVAFLPGVARL